MSEEDPHPEFQFPIKIEGDESAIPVEFRPLYRKDPNDGSLQLISNLARQFEAPGLKTALQKSRAEIRDVERREREKHKKTLEMLGAESADEVPLKLEELRRAGTNSSAAEEVFRRRETELRNNLQAKDAELVRVKRDFNDRVVGEEVTRAIAAAKGNVRTLLPHVRNAVALKEEGGRHFTRILDQDGEIRYGANGPMSVDEYVAELRTDADFAGLFQGSGSTGSGTRGASGTGGAGVGGSATQSMDMAAWRLKMSKAKPEERTELMRAKAAGRIVIRD